MLTLVRDTSERRMAVAKKSSLIGLSAPWLMEPCRAAGVLDPHGPVGAAGACAHPAECRYWASCLSW